MSELSDRVVALIGAADSAIWVRSYEHEDALRELAPAFQKHGWIYMTWDAENGVRMPRDLKATVPEDKGPAAAMDFLRGVANTVPKDEHGQKKNRVILIMRNLHRYIFNATGALQNPGWVQKMEHIIEDGTREGFHLVVLSTEAAPIPAELEKTFRTVDHELPGPDEIWDLLCSVEDETKLPKRDSAEAKNMLDVCGGLTRSEILLAASLSVAGKHKTIVPEVLWELKEAMIKKRGSLRIYKGEESFAMLGGLEAVKDYCLRAFNSPNVDGKKVRRRGILLLGVPGTGKSAFSKALGHEIGRATLKLDVGSLMGGIVGLTEANVRAAIKTIDAASPNVTFVDEVEKALKGTTGQSLDSGVGARMLGTLLEWMQDHESDVYLIATCNDIESLPPEFLRRFDAIFFMDKPPKPQREAIWEIYCKHYEIDAKEERPDDTDWTGADIQKCCITKKMLDIPLVEAAKYVIPIAKSNQEKIDRLRGWAHKRVLDANYPGVFDQNRKDGSCEPAGGDPAKPAARRRALRN